MKREDKINKREFYRTVFDGQFKCDVCYCWVNDDKRSKLLNDACEDCVELAIIEECK